ncbi:radical SAM protein [Fusibacter bizertensis]
MKLNSNLKLFGLSKAMEYLEKDPDKNFLKLMQFTDQILPSNSFEPQRRAIKNAFKEKNNWYDLIMKIYDLDSEIRVSFFENFILNANLIGFKEQEKNKKNHDCNIPWAILLDPTTACNLSCKGCWSAEYGNNYNLSFQTIDSIIKQGKALGTYIYIYTGGEPLVRKSDLIKLCEIHDDCIFLTFTNGTLIDDEFCIDIKRVKNLIPAISLEGFEEANDSRRGSGIYDKVQYAMRLLKKHNIPFGISTCYTSTNYLDVTSEEFFDYITNEGALFIWLFHYMPVGKDAIPQLMVSPEQRLHVMNKVSEFRKSKPIFSMDFQNDAKYVGGCIAGGRRYLHINANGDVEPCVFVHYSNANINQVTLLDALKSPIFMQYYNNQPFNANMLKPCPMLENPQILPALVSLSRAHSTDYLAPESADELCSKTTRYAIEWSEAVKNN